VHGESKIMRGDGVIEALVKIGKNNDNIKPPRVPMVVKLVRHQLSNMEVMLF